MKKYYLLLLLSLIYLHVNAQVTQFTPYDDLPQINKSYKPAYSENMPDWGKMLYQYPINFNEIDKAFIKWEAVNKDKKTPLMRYYKIWRKALAPYIKSDGEIEVPNVERINRNLVRVQQRRAQPMKVPVNKNNNSDWTLWGPKETFWLNNGNTEIPGPASWQVNVYSIDVTDKNPNLLYCGSETGFVNKSVDKGENWTLVGRDYPFGGGVGAVAIHPINLDTVLIGAGNAIHRTEDGGNTWQRVYNTGGINRMKYDYKNANNVIACASNGIYLSSNTGVNWRKVYHRDTWDIEYKPDDNKTVYALTRNNENRFTVIESKDGGKSFISITSFPDSLKNESGGLLAVTPAEPNSMWVLMLSANLNKRPFIYKGTYDGNEWSWRLLHKGSDGAFTSNKLTNGQGYFDIVLEVSPVDPKIVFAGTTSLFKSTTGGIFFRPVGGYAGPFSIHPDIQDMKMLANGDTWVSTDGGVNYTSDNFQNHSNYLPLNKMLIGSDFWGFHQGWNEDIVVAGRYHNGNTAIADFYGDKALRMGGGEDATGWVIQGKSRHVAFNDLGAGWILPRTAEGVVEGRFMFTKHPNMDGYGSLRSNVVMHPYYSGQIYVGSEKGLWISKDFGATFDMLYEFPGKVRYFDISTQNPDVMYVDVVDNGLFKTSDGGVTFKSIRSPLNNITGNVRFVISPYDSEVVYATLTHGAWDNTRSEVYRSPNGGKNWLPWSNFGRNVIIKSLAIQPTTDGKDLVYAIVDTYGYNSGTVYYRKDGLGSWIEFGNNYPKGMRVNHALPFYRDGKLRVGGGAGVWESPLAEPKFTPIVVPWVKYEEYKSNLDTVEFDCHSYLNHEGAVWTWEFAPEAKYVNDIHARNPKAIFAPGEYSVTLSITQDGVTKTKTVENMFKVNEAPSIDDCNNPAELPQQFMRIVSVDSEHPGNEAVNVLDGEIQTIWHTKWGNGETHYPHEIVIDLGGDYEVSKMTYYPRQGNSNGVIEKFELYITNDLSSWGDPVKTGNFQYISSPSLVEFEPIVGRYAKLIAKKEINDNNWASAAEITFTGCKNTNTAINDLIKNNHLNAFPIPAQNVITINLPFQNGLNAYDVYLYSSNGQLLYNGKADENQKFVSIDVNKYPSGNYLVMLIDKAGISYRVKFIKN